MKKSAVGVNLFGVTEFRDQSCGFGNLLKNKFWIKALEVV
jgi:hypothetical protein